MAEALVGDSSSDFWQEVSHCKINKQTSAPHVDGVHCSDANIANLWASKFKNLLTSPGQKAHRQLDYMLKITTGELEAPNVTPDTIQRAIKKLKRKNPMVRFYHLII